MIVETQQNITINSQNDVSKNNFSEATKNIEDIYKIEQQDDFVTNLGTGGLGSVIGAGVGETVHPITITTVAENPNHYYAIGTGVGISEKPTHSCSSYNAWSSC